MLKNVFVRLECWSLKLLEFTMRARSLVCVVLGICNVLLTALFHSILSWCTYLLSVSHVCEPYQEQQYVCNRLPFTSPGTLVNFTFSLLTCDMKIPVLRVTSSESHKSCDIIFPRCLSGRVFRVWSVSPIRHYCQNFERNTSMVQLLLNTLFLKLKMVL